MLLDLHGFLMSLFSTLVLESEGAANEFYTKLQLF